MIGHYIWVIIVGFVAGLIARFIIPGPNNPSGFIMTAVLGIVGSVIANFIAVKVGWIGPGEGGQLLSGMLGHDGLIRSGFRARWGSVRTAYQTDLCTVPATG